MTLFVGISVTFFIYTLGRIPGKAFIGDLVTTGFSLVLFVGVKLGLLETLTGLDGMVTTYWVYFTMLKKLLISSLSPFPEHKLSL